MAATALTMAGIVALPRLLPAPEIQENRVLAPPPAPMRGPADLAAFRKSADAYVADNFPGRIYLIAALNRVRLALGATGSPKVIAGRDGWLFSDNGTQLGAARGDPEMAPDELTTWLGGLSGRSAAARNVGATYVLLIAPVKETVHSDKGPWWFRRNYLRPATQLPELANAARAGLVIYPARDLERRARWGLETYSRHDTHWTGLGAYYAYHALMSQLQAHGLAEGPRPLEAFQEVRRFERNKPRDMALMLGVASFVRVDYPELEDPAAPSTVRTYLTERRDWTAPQVIDTGLAGKPVLMMTMDSFSTALLPFLYGHFSRIVLSHGQDGAWRADLIARFQPDIVLTEVTENGVRQVMQGSPEPPADDLARIRRVVAERGLHLPIDPAADDRPLRYIQGTDKPDRLTGSGGPDEIQAGPGDDVVAGMGGSDVIRGGRGRDRLDGGDGDDSLAGGRDDDVLIGGRGADVFNGFAGAGTDEVLDFSITDGDRVELDPGTAFAIRQEGPDTVIELEGGRLILRGVTAADLRPGSVRAR